jgi:lipoate-protein ligase B
VKLEDKIAYFVDLGKIDFEELENIQKQVLSNQDLPKYILLHARVNPHINFGSNKGRNKLSKELEERYSKIIGNGFYDENGHYSENTIKYFYQNGINGYPFSKSKRGGGATVYTPGQHLYFPVWHLTDSKVFSEKVKSIRKFNEQLHDAMLVATNEIIHGAYLIETVFSQVIQDVNKDLYVEKNGMHYKIGAKGIDFNDISGKNVGGFSLFVNDLNTDLMENVHVCGFSPEEMQIITMENIKEEKIESKKVHQSVLYGLNKETGVEFEKIEKNEFMKKLN